GRRTAVTTAVPGTGGRPVTDALPRRDRTQGRPRRRVHPGRLVRAHPGRSRRSRDAVGRQRGARPVLAGQWRVGGGHRWRALPRDSVAAPAVRSHERPRAHVSATVPGRAPYWRLSANRVPLLAGRHRLTYAPLAKCPSRDVWFARGSCSRPGDPASVAG